MKISKNLIKYIFTILNNNCKVIFLTYLVVFLIVKYTDIEDPRQ